MTIRVRIKRSVSGYVPGKVYDVNDEKLVADLLESGLGQKIPNNKELLTSLLKEYNMAKPKQGDWKRAESEYSTPTFAEEQEARAE